MISRVSPDAVSASRPPGSPGGWPLADAVMLEDLHDLGEAYALFEDLSPIDAYHKAARLLKLPEADYHWMVDFALCLFHDIFFCRADDFYLDARLYLERAGQSGSTWESLSGQAEWLLGKDAEPA